MTLEEIVRQLGLASRTPTAALDRKVTGGYASDLLSCVMGKASEGNIWVTLQAHPNVVAVASLLNLAGVVITEGVVPEETTLQKAEQQSIAIMTTEATTFAVVGQLYALGVRGVGE
jgi:hypothetical protein